MAIYELIRSIPFITATYKFKYFGINLTIDVKRLLARKLYNIRESTRRTHTQNRKVLCSWIARINVIKISTLLKAIYAFNEIPIKRGSIFFSDAVKVNPKSPKIIRHPKS